MKGTDTPTPILVLGNKLDLTANRRVDHEEAKRWCDERNLKYLETSAKTKENVEAVSSLCNVVSRFPAFLAIFKF